ncbi:MAG: bifunctional folylpolyglutamate synthase/dihydrofolate synthase [Clostridiales bacterium]|nr:bifunctional folylpolyglutamate synthase/dihydrofolate synthase [Clostridiales bacterium]
MSNDTPEFLKDALKFGINLGLERMNRLDELLGDPQKQLHVIHVAGTNGKGSTVSYISSILASAGLKVGVYTSPFLERFSERIRIIDGRHGLDILSEDETYGEIDDHDLAELSEKVKAAAELMVSQGYEHPTEFELVTAIAYLYFEKKQIDIAVLETGLGGRLDSTNVIDDPLCTVITSIGYDHTDRLGDTIGQIAMEKAGIIKPHRPVIVADPDEMLLSSEDALKVREVIRDAARSKDAPLKFVRAGKYSEKYTPDGRMIFSFEGEMAVFDTALVGTHQIRNAALAVSCARQIPVVSEEDIAYGIRHTKWKGRAEFLSIDPPVILDGGHNRQCAQSLAAVLNKIQDGKLCEGKLRVVMGVMADKDVKGMLEVLKLEAPDVEEIFCVRVDNPRTLAPSELCNYIELVYNGTVKTECFEDASKAVSEAYSRTRADGIPLLVTGSLYLIGQIRGYLRSIVLKG